MGNGKQWRPAVAKVIASMVESEQKAKGMMAQGFKMSDSQWEYTYRCFEMMSFTVFGAYYCHCGAKIENWANYGFVAKCLFVLV